MVGKGNTVRLISAEGFEFVIDYEAACVSNTIKNMLSSKGSFTETELGEIRFPEISTPILEKVCQYFYYKLRYTNRYDLYFRDLSLSFPDVDIDSTHDIPPFDIAPEHALELLMASNYLDT